MAFHEWVVVKINTNNGERIGIIQEYDVTGEVLLNDLEEDEAIIESERISKKLGIPMFDNNIDELI